MIFLSLLFNFTGVIGLLPPPAHLNVRLDMYNNLEVPVFFGINFDSPQTASLDMGSRSLHMLPEEVRYQGLTIGPFTLLGGTEFANLYVASASNVVPSRVRKIGANFASDFANAVGKLMFVPSETSESVKLVVGGFDAQNFCADPIVLVPALFVLPAGEIGMVYVSVTFLDRFGEEITEPTEPEMFRFDSYYHVDWVPSVVMDDFQQIVETDFGLPLYSEFTTEIQAPCADIIDRMPSIRYSILDRDRNNYVIDVILGPRDYIRIDENGHCEVQLLEVEGEIAEYNPAPQDTPNILGTNFLRQVAVLFDYRNRQFGFCEPL